MKSTSKNPKPSTLNQHLLKKSWATQKRAPWVLEDPGELPLRVQGFRGLGLRIEGLGFEILGV